MSDRFYEDSMDDLALDEAEGAADLSDDSADFADVDSGDESDEFLRGLIGGVGRIAGGLMGGGAGGGGEGFDEMDLGDDEFDAAGDEFADADSGDNESFEDSVADALESEDTDEFFRRIAGIARRVGRTVGRVARVVAPIASAIPIPQAQAVGRIAGVLGRVLFDGADEFDALEDVFEEAEADNAIDAAAPIIAGLTIRSRMPGIARAPQGVRRQLVRSVAQATRTIARRQGPRAARVMPAVVGRVQQAVRRRAIAPRRVPAAVRQMAQRVARNPRLIRGLVQQARVQAGRRPARVRRNAQGGVAPAVVAPGAIVGGRRPRSFSLRGPVQITIRSL